MKKTSILKILIIFCLAALFSSFSFAEQNNIAEENVVTKEEVIYANLNENGNVDEIYVVNIFSNAKDKMLYDFGNYKRVNNLTDERIMILSDGVVLVNSSKDKFYYEGKLNSRELPWEFDVKYYINDKEISPADLAGKSGKLKIKMQIMENKTVNPVFYEKLVIQISLNLDADKCKNIGAKDAIIANAGNNKQLNFTVLPGNIEDNNKFTVTSDVIDFEFKGVTFACINLNIKPEVDEKYFADDFDELISAVRKLDDGVGEYKDGILELKDNYNLFHDAIKEIKDAVKELSDGAVELSDGVVELDDGVSELKDGTDELYDGTEKLKTGTSDLYDGLKEFKDGEKELVDGLKEMDDGIKKLHTGFAQFGTGLAGVSAGLNELSVPAVPTPGAPTAGEKIKGGAEQMYGGLLSDPATVAALNAAGIVLDANSSADDINAIIANLDPSIPANAPLIQLLGTLAFYKGVSEYVDGVGGVAKVMREDVLGGYNGLNAGLTQVKDGSNKIVKNLDKFSEGSEKLKDGSFKLYDATKKLVDGVKELNDGVSELKDGTTELKDGSKKLADGTVELADGMDEVEEGSDEINSGLSELFDGISEIKDGTSKFLRETVNMRKEMPAKVEDKIKEMTGSDFVPESFVSENNRNVTSVQFIMKTKEIKKVKKEAKAEKEPEKKKSIKDNVVNLFS